MDKILNLFSKITKMLATCVLALLICVIVYFGINTLYLGYKQQNTRVSYRYNVPEFIKTLEQENSQTNDKKPNALDENIVKDLAVFSKENYLDSYQEKIVKNRLLQIDVKERQDFYNGYKIFYKEFIKETEPADEKEKDFFWSEIGNTQYYILDYYTTLYNNEKLSVENEIKSLEAKKATNITILLGCVYAFLVLLFLPLLIKIEENTRK